MTDDFDDLEDSNDSNLVKDLRKQLKAAKAQADELATQAAEYQRQTRKTAVAQFLSEKGARPGLAKFYTDDDTSPEALSKWLQDNAEDFGLDLGGEVDEETAANAARISEATRTAPAQVAGGDLLHKLATLPREELVKQGFLTDWK